MQFLDLQGVKNLWAAVKSYADSAASTAVSSQNLATVATSGKASDVSITAISGVTTTTGVQGALESIYSQLSDVKNTADAAKSSADSWVDKFVSAGTYNATTKQIELTIANGDSVKFDVSDLLDNVNFTGANTVLTGYTAGTSSADIVATDSVNVAIGKLVNKIAAINTTASSAIQSITTGSANGTISVDGTDVAVKGLGSAAYTASTAYDASGAASAVLGTSSDTATANTVYGAKAAASAAQTKADNIATNLAKQSITVTESSSTTTGKVVFVYATGESTTSTVTIDAISASDITSIVSGE